MIHVHPLNDLKSHLLEGTTCECEPRIIVEPNKEIIVVHSSFDGKEGVEITRDILERPHRSTEEIQNLLSKKQLKALKKAIKKNTPKEDK